MGREWEEGSNMIAGEEKDFAIYLEIDVALQSDRGTCKATHPQFATLPYFYQEPKVFFSFVHNFESLRIAEGVASSSDPLEIHCDTEVS